MSLAKLRLYDTTHYKVQTDVDEELANDLGRRMDVMYDEYSERLGEFMSGKSDRKLEVFIFRNRADYIRLTGNAASAGAFSRKQKLLAATLGGQNRDELRRTLQHEAFHQFAFFAIGDSLPVWVNEGLAQVFEEGIFTGHGFTLGQIPPRRLRMLQSDIENGRLIDFNEMLRMTPEQWTINMQEPLTAQIEYNQSWAMMHFLIFATDDAGKFKFRDRVIDMLRSLHSDKEGMPAFTEAFGENIAGFQKRFTEYAMKLTPTPEATYIEHQDVLADLLVDLKARGREFTNMRSYREFLVAVGHHMKHRKGEFAWDTSNDLKSYFCDMDGHILDVAQLSFEFRDGAPIRDIVCRPMPGLNLRTRFIQGDEKLEHETLAETE